MSASKPLHGPLHGVRILDLTTVVMGPYATQLLGDLGADVIKVEAPGGDDLRAVGPMRHPGMGAISLHLNRNKRSIVLDLKNEDARRALLAIAATCDALIFNTRPQSMERLHLGYDVFREVNPRIVYVSTTGYGSNGPLAGRPAYDDLIQGASGIAELFAEQSRDEPRYAPINIADRTTGLHAALALLAAVLHARATGEGQAVEVAMYEAMSQMVMGDHLGGKSFEPPLGETGYERLLTPHRRPYRTADGHLSIVIYNDRHWHSFLNIVGRADLISHPAFRSHTARSANIRSVYGFVARTLSERTSAEWLDLLSPADIPACRLNTTASLLDDAHLRAVDLFPLTEHPSEGTLRTIAPVGRFSSTPTSIRIPAPRIGQHGTQILGEAGYGAEAIVELIASGATRRADAPRTTDEAPRPVERLDAPP